MNGSEDSGVLQVPGSGNSGNANSTHCAHTLSDLCFLSRLLCYFASLGDDLMLTCAETASTWEFMFPQLNREMAFSQRLTAQNMKAQLRFLEMEQTGDVKYTPGLPHRIRLKLEFLLQSHCFLASTFSIQFSLPYSLTVFSWEHTSLSAPHMNIHLRVCFCGT